MQNTNQCSFQWVTNPLCILDHYPVRVIFISIALNGYSNKPFQIKLSKSVFLSWFHIAHLIILIDNYLIGNCHFKMDDHRWDWSLSITRWQTVWGRIHTSHYRQISNIIRTKYPKLKCFSSRLAVVFVQYIEAKCEVENEDVVGAAPTGDSPTTYEWSTMLSPTKARLILEVLR